MDLWIGLVSLITGAVGGIASVAVAAFTNVGDRIGNYFVERKLAGFKHSLETQIEQLRARLAHLTDRGVRSNELEYGATIAAWESLVAAYLATYNSIIRYSSAPDFTYMPDDEVEEYLKTTDFSAQHQKLLMDQKAADRNRTYVRIK